MLSSALSACALRVAKHLGWRSEDLEAVVASYARLPEVMEGILPGFCGDVRRCDCDFDCFFFFMVSLVGSKMCSF